MKNIIYNIPEPLFNLKSATGSTLITEDGKKLIDFTSGWNVTNLGWNNLEITTAVIKQASINHYTPMWSAEKIQEDLAELIVSSLPGGLERIGRATGGTEANEEALKIARAFTGRKKIIGFRNTYHGQSFGTLSLGYSPESIKNIAPLVGDFVQMKFPEDKKDLDPKESLNEFALNLEKKLSNRKVAAILCEAGIVTGWGDTKVAPNGFLSVVRRLTKKYGTLMILDEVGSGFSRCGKLFALEIEKVTPDILTLAKGISNGAAPIGCMITSKKIADKTFGQAEIISTFGWTPIACAAALKTLQIHKRDKVWEKAEKDGQYLLNRLKSELSSSEAVKEIKGLGMIIGVTLKNKEMATMVINKAYKNGLHLVGDGNLNIQLMPPLTIKREDLDLGINILLEAIKI